MQPLQCGSQHQLANLHLSTHRTTPEHQMTTVMQPFQCDLQAQIPKHPITTHTSTPKAASSHRYTAAKKNDKPTAAAPVAHTRYLSSSPAATLHGKTQGFVLRLPPQNIAHATSCSLTMRFAASTRKLAPIYAQNNTRTPNDNSHAAIPMRSASTDSKTPYNYAHKHTQSSFKPPLHCGKKNDKPTAAAPVAHTRYLSSSPAATLHGKTQGFVLRLPPQNIAHATSCSHYNAICHRSFKKRIKLRTQEQPLAAKHIGGTIRALPFLATSHRHHLPSSPPPFVTTLCHTFLFYVMYHPSSSSILL